MAQAPATPKARRALLSLTASLAGPRVAAHLPHAASEAAALAARRRPLSRPDRPEVVFLMPLVGRHHVGDWSAVCARLSATVTSFQRQSNAAWRLVICGQDHPGDALPDDPRLQFLPFTDTVPGNDKWRKLNRLCHALPEVGPRQGYAMPFDADDLLAPDTVAEMVTRRRAGGYLISRGLLYDAADQLWGHARPQSLRHPGQKAFWKLCGSCAAFGFDLSSSPDDAHLLAAITAHEHRMFPYLARLAGRPLAPLEQDAALYILNHGENFGIRRGRVRFKTRFVRRFRLTDPTEIARAETRFPIPR